MSTNCVLFKQVCVCNPSIFTRHCSKHQKVNSSEPLIALDQILFPFLLLQNYAIVFSAFKTVANTHAGYTHPTHSYYSKALYNSILNICMIFIFIGILSLHQNKTKQKLSDCAGNMIFDQDLWKSKLLTLFTRMSLNLEVLRVIQQLIKALITSTRG